jgi:catalase
MQSMSLNTDTCIEEPGNIAGHMRGVDPTVQAHQVGHFRRANEEYGRRVAEGPRPHELSEREPRGPS